MSSVSRGSKARNHCAPEASKGRSRAVERGASKHGEVKSKKKEKGDAKVRTVQRQYNLNCSSSRNGTKGAKQVTHKTPAVGVDVAELPAGTSEEEAPVAELPTGTLEEEEEKKNPILEDEREPEEVAPFICTPEPVPVVGPGPGQKPATVKSGLGAEHQKGEERLALEKISEEMDIPIAKLRVIEKLLLERQNQKQHQEQEKGPEEPVRKISLRDGWEVLEDSSRQAPTYKLPSIPNTVLHVMVLPIVEKTSHSVLEGKEKILSKTSESLSRIEASIKERSATRKAGIFTARTGPEYTLSSVSFAQSISI